MTLSPSSATYESGVYYYTFDYNSETQDPLHSSAHNNVFKLRTTSWGYFSDDFINKSAQHADERLENVDIFVFRGHGNDGLLGFRNGTGDYNGRIYANTGMGLTDYPGYYFIDNHPVNSFSSIRCALLLGCNTAGESYFGGYNLTDEIYKRGAHCVIGTTDTIRQGFSNPFFTTFIGQIEGGKSIIEAYNKGADDAASINGSEFPGYYIGDTMQYLK